MRHLVRFLTTLAVAAATACASHQPPAPGTQTRATGQSTVDVQLLAFNDFHGSLEPPAGSNGQIRQTAAGGLEFLATHLRTLAAANRNTVVVSAGDNIGASPLISGMFHDEPSIEGLSDAGLQLSAVGNHELDEGWAELYRMQKGGCHPVDGCQDNTPFTGATFRFLAANLVVDPARTDKDALQRSGWQRDNPGPQPRPLFPAYTVRDFNGVKVGFIGLTLRGVTELVSPAGLVGIRVLPEADAANQAAKELHARGVNAIVVLIHEGGSPKGEPGQEDPNTCEDFRGAIIDVVNQMSSDIDVVVSGHSHRAYICTIGTKLVTSAASLGRLITDIDLKVNKRTGKVEAKTANNVTVTRDVPAAASERTIIEHYRPLASSVAARPVGTTASPISQLRNAAGESGLGDLVADGMLEAARASAGRVDFAMTNSGGIRNDLVPSGPVNGTLRTITYGDVFNVLPFGNIVVVRTLTGDAIARMLDQQFDRTTRYLQVSKELTYTWSASKPEGSRVNRASIRIEGKPLVATEKYRVATVDFLWNGGDSFSVATEGTDPTAVGNDVDVFLAYLGKHSPVAPGPQNRITREP